MRRVFISTLFPFPLSGQLRVKQGGDVFFVVVFIPEEKKRKESECQCPFLVQTRKRSRIYRKKKKKRKERGLFPFCSLEIKGTKEVELVQFAQGQGSRSPAGLLSAKQSASRRQRNRTHIDNLEKKHKRKNYKIFNPPPKKRKYSEYTV